jgi:hypothetical protein
MERRHAIPRFFSFTVNQNWSSGQCHPGERRGHLHRRWGHIRFPPNKNKFLLLLCHLVWHWERWSENKVKIVRLTEKLGTLLKNVTYHPMYTLVGFDFITHSSAGRDDTTRPRRQGENLHFYPPLDPSFISKGIVPGGNRSPVRPDVHP